MVYGDPPWGFKGRAVYQLQLVKSKEARKYVPADLKLVELFGYTLGGFYLARYTDSPVGAFDELVVLGGLVWNAPTSCAWAARVYVNNREARNHGLVHVGLPSRFAQFTNLSGNQSRNQEELSNQTWWSRPPIDANQTKGTKDSSSNLLTIRNAENRLFFGAKKGLKVPVCTFSIGKDMKGWKGPEIKMQLPSFSGNTANCPHLLKYSLALKTRVRAARPLKLHWNGEDAGQKKNSEDMKDLLMGTPILSLSFENMEMVVQAPIKVVNKQLSTKSASREILA